MNTKEIKKKTHLVGISGKVGSGKDLVFNTLNKELKGEWENKKFSEGVKKIVSILTGYSLEELEDRNIKNKKLGPDWTRYKIRYEKNSNFFILDFIFKSKKDAEKYAINLKGLKYYIFPEELTVRDLFILIGNDAGRELIHPNIWINQTFKNFNNKFSRWIITDVRYENEANFIKSQGGILIRINRDPHCDLCGETKNLLWEASYPFNYTCNCCGFMWELSSSKSEISLDNYLSWDAKVGNNGTKQVLEQKIINIIHELEL